MTRFFFFLGLIVMVLSGGCTLFFIQDLLKNSAGGYLIFTLVGLPPFLIGFWMYYAAKKKLSDEQNSAHSAAQEKKPPQD